MKPSKSNNPQITIAQGQFYSGPVPDPESLAKYESISPGFADRLLRMAEKEQHERISTHNKIIDTEKELNIIELNNYKRGQIFALISVLLVVGLYVYAFTLGYAKEAKDIAITVIASIAAIFITGRWFSQKKTQIKDSKE